MLSSYESIPSRRRPLSPRHSSRRADARAPTAANAASPVAATRPPPPGFTQTIVLWPEGAPLAQGTTEGDIPKLFTYPAAGAGPHSAVIVMPGGGYTHLVMEQEGATEARWLAAHGISAFVLEYRLVARLRIPRAHAGRLARHPLCPLARRGAGREAQTRSASGDSPPAAISPATWPPSTSAGDPAAADPIDRVSDRPDFAIISYGVLALDLYARAGDVPLQTLIGQHPTQAAIDAVDPSKHVSADTSPCLIYSTTGDRTVDPRNAAEFYEALKAAGVPVELHIFELGAHGTHMGVDQPPAMRELTVFPTLLANWLQLHGWMPHSRRNPAAQGSGTAINPPAHLWEISAPFHAFAAIFSPILPASHAPRLHSACRCNGFMTPPPAPGTYPQNSVGFALAFTGTPLLVSLQLMTRSTSEVGFKGRAGRLIGDASQRLNGRQRRERNSWRESEVASRAEPEGWQSAQVGGHLEGKAGRLAPGDGRRLARRHSQGLTGGASRWLAQGGAGGCNDR